MYIRCVVLSGVPDRGFSSSLVFSLIDVGHIVLNSYTSVGLQHLYVMSPWPGTSYTRHSSPVVYELYSIYCQALSITSSKCTH